MKFYNDIITKTTKIFDNLEDELTQLPVVQNTNHVLDAFTLSAETFFCDLYTTDAWINQSRMRTQEIFNHYENDGVICEHIWFNLINSDINSNLFNKCRPLVGVVIVDEELLADTKILNELKFNSGNYAIMILFHNSLSESKLKKLKFDCQGKVITAICVSSEISKRNILDTFEHNILSIDRLKDLQTLALLRFLRPQILNIWQAILTNKNDVEKINKKREELLGNIRKIELDRSNSEQTSKAKQEIQIQIRNLDKDLKKKYANLNKNKTGGFSKLIDKEIDNLKELDRKILEHIPKFETTISQKYMKNFESMINTDIEKKFQEDKDEIFSKMNNVLKQFHFTSTNNKSSQIKLNIDYSSFPSADSVIQSTINLEEVYKGELPKMNFQTYIIQVRQQVFFIFLLSSLISPIFSAANFFFEKFDSKYIRLLSVITGLISVFLAIYYGIDLSKKIPKMNAELLQQELDKAKKLLQNNSKRIVADATREWLNNITIWLNETTETINTQLDNLVISHNNAKQTEIKNIDNKLQDIVQEYNSRKANVDNSEKIFSSYILEFQNNLNSLESKIMQFNNFK